MGHNDVRVTSCSTDFDKKMRVNGHGSLEGVGGLKTNEAYHSKADALLFPYLFLLKSYLRFFLEMLVL